MSIYASPPITVNRPLLRCGGVPHNDLPSSLTLHKDIGESTSITLNRPVFIGPIADPYTRHDGRATVPSDLPLFDAGRVIINRVLLIQRDEGFLPVERPVVDRVDEVMGEDPIQRAQVA